MIWKSTKTFFAYHPCHFRKKCHLNQKPCYIFTRNKNTLFSKFNLRRVWLWAVVLCTKTELVARIKTFDSLKWPWGVHYYHYISGNILQVTPWQQYLWLSFPLDCSPPITRGASKELDGNNVFLASSFHAWDHHINNKLFGWLENKILLSWFFCLFVFFAFSLAAPSS